MRTQFVVGATVAAVWIGAAAHPATGQEISLTQAVREFNAESKKNAVGKGQPPVTEDEVVAAIRGWIRERMPASDNVYGAFQKVAATGAMPVGSKLSFTTSWTGYNGYDFDVWWVDLNVATGKGTGYTFRIRDQKLGSRPSKK